MKNFKIIICVLLLSSSAFVEAQNWTDLGVKMNRGVGPFFNDTESNLLYFGGSFAFYSADGDTTYTTGIAAYNGDSIFSVGCGFDWNCISHITPSAGIGGINSITKYNSEIIGGGAFLKADGKPIRRIARWDGTTWDSLGHGMNGPVRRVYSANNELYVGGSFDSAGYIPANGLARWNGTEWSTVGDLPNYHCCNDINFVFAIIEYKDELYIGGKLHDSLGNQTNVARYNGTSWKGLENGITGNFAGINDMEIYNGELYIAGVFKKSEGNPDDNIARWDGEQWHAVGGGVVGTTGGNAQIYDLNVFNNELYAVGQFRFAGGVPADCIAKWDGQEWCGLGSEFDNTIAGIGVYNNELYIGGGFWTIDGDSITRLAKWIGGDYVDTCGSLIGINDPQPNNDHLQLYPNPANNNLIIETGNYTKSTYSIYDITGRLLHTGNITQKSSIDISVFAEGVYVVQLQSGQGIVSKRFIKQ